MHSHTSIVHTLPHTHVLTHARTPATVKDDQLPGEKKKPEQSASPTIVEQLGLSFAAKPNSKVRVYVCVFTSVYWFLYNVSSWACPWLPNQISLSLSLARALSVALSLWVWAGAAYARLARLQR
jgi:hypothetical protein